MADNIYNPEFVKQLFNRMSSSYERMNYITSFGFSIRWRRMFLNPLLATDSEIEILDLLSGMGETWNAIAQKFPNANISALDFSSEMMKKASIKNNKRFNGNVKLLQQNLLQNSLPTNHYHYVTCAFGLKTFDDEQLRILASEIHRVLKVGGEFSFVEVSKPNNIILRGLYGFYLGQVIPILGKLLLGNPTEYKMLWRYTNKFENSLSTMDIFAKAGLITNHSSYFFGCATGFYGRK